MKYSAQIQNTRGSHDIMLKVGEKAQTLSIAPRPTGGSSISGGELLFLAIATCYCNDIYREAAVFDIQVDSVEVEVEGNFEAPGKTATNVVYRARVHANASAEKLRELMLHTAAITEIQNTLRLGTPVKFEMR
jgi:uncharacterized OsmC-like protein